MKKLFFSLLALMSTFSASAQVEPEAGQTYYIQHVDDGQFFSRGNAWGTQASLDKLGMPFTLVGSDLNSVQLQIKGQTSVLGFDTGLYTDAGGGNARSYKIEGNATDGYTIISTTGYACTIKGTAIDGSTTATPAKWKFLTKAQRDEYVAKAVATAKTDAYTTAGLTETETVKEAEITSKVTNSTLASNIDGWTKTIVRDQGGQPASSAGCTEFWQATGTLTQTVSGLTPNGLYRLTMRAQYRAISDNPNCYNLYAEGYDNVNATIGLNGNAVAVCGWAKDAKNNGDPNGRQAFTNIVNSGADKYFNEVYGNADADGNLTIQIVKPGYGGGSDWFTFSTVRLYEISNKVTAEEVAALLATVPAGKMNADVQTALNTAKTNIEANGSIDNYNALQSAIDNANASIALYSTINATLETEKAHAAKYGVAAAFASAISDIQSAYDNGTLTENKTAELQAALANLLQNNDNSFTNASAIAEGQDFYIQNVATGLFLGGANDWGTHASIIEHGIAFTTAKVSDGVYTLDSHTYNNANDHFFGGAFIDGGATNVTFEEISENIYAMKVGDKYVVADAITTLVENSANNTDSKLAQWKLISYDDRLAEMKAGNTDATWMIKEANISRNLRLTFGNSAWENDGAYGGTYENQCMEKFHAANDCHQTIAVPNGTYTLTAQAFCRQDDGSAAGAQLYANDYTTDVAAILPTTTQNMAGASAAFSNGEYVHTIEGIVVTDNKLTIGVKTEDANNWLIWDNFTLTLVSDGDLNHEASEKNGYLKLGENKYVKIGGSETTEAGVTENVMEASKVTLKTNIAGISTIKFDDANYMMWNGEKVYTDGTIQQKKNTHKSFWLAEADGLKNIETGKYLGIDGTNATLADAAIAYEIVDITYATPEEIAALNTAIEAAEAKTIGFQKGDYSPYANAEAIKALADAKDIDTENPVDQKTVVDATTALTGATWTPNAKEVNAINNGDLEGTYAEVSGSGVNSDRAIYLPEGWSFRKNGIDKNDIIILQSGDKADNNFSAMTALDNGDAHTLKYRGKWGTTTNLDFYQKITLPAGKYVLSCDAWKSGLGGDGKIYVGASNEASLDGNDTSWRKLSLTFTLEEENTVEVGFNIKHTSDGSEKFIGFDNFELYSAPTEAELSDIQMQETENPWTGDMTTYVVGSDAEGNEFTFIFADGEYAGASLYTAEGDECDASEGTATFTLTEDGKALEATLTFTDYADFEKTYHVTGLVPYATANMAVNAEAKWGTFVAPFDVTIPAGVTACVVEGVDEDGATLVMTDLTEMGVDCIPAYTPVLLNAEDGLTKTEVKGFAVPREDDEPIEYGPLTGVLTKTPAPVGSYILQNNNNKVGFYKVAAEGLFVGANRCYLTKSESSVKAFFFDQETAIKAIDALTSGKAEIYDMNGRKLNKMQKGINIVNGVKVLVK